MDERHDARRDFSAGGQRAPIDQTPEYRGEMDRLHRERQRQIANNTLGPMPPGYGDGDPRITLVVACLWIAAAIALGGISFTMSGLMQMMILGWAILLVAVALVPAILFSPLTRGFTGLQGAAAGKARRDAFLVLLLSFGGARLFASGLITVSPIVPLLTVIVAAALLFAVLRARLPGRAAMVMALANALGATIAIWIGRGLLFPLLAS